MKYVWFLPAEYVASVATILVMLAGLAYMAQMKGVAATLLITGVLLVISPAFDPLIESGVDTAFDLGEYAFHFLPWWMLLVIAAVLLLWLIKAIIQFLFDKETGQRVMADILASLVKRGLRGLVYLAPLLVLAWAFWYYLLT